MSSRIDFYETYYKNVSPTTFEVKRSGDKIIIEGFDKKYPKNFKPKDVKQYPVNQEKFNTNDKGKRYNVYFKDTTSALGLTTSFRYEEEDDVLNRKKAIKQGKRYLSKYHSGKYIPQKYFEFVDIVEVDYNGNEILQKGGKINNDEVIYTKEFKNWFGDWEKVSKNIEKLVDDGVIDEYDYEPRLPTIIDPKDRGKDIANPLYDGVSKVMRGRMPEKVYHGTLTHKDFTVFSRTGFGGYYFSNDKDVARTYGSNIYEVYLDIKNPIVYDFRTCESFDEAQTTVSQISYAVQEARDLNKDVTILRHGVPYIIPKDCDGVIFKNLNDVENQEYGNGLDDKDYIEWNEKNCSTIYVVYKSEQIKLTNGKNVKFDPNNPDIRYEEGGKTQNDMKEIKVGDSVIPYGYKFTLIISEGWKNVLGKNVWKGTSKNGNYQLAFVESGKDTIVKNNNSTYSEGGEIKNHSDIVKLIESSDTYMTLYDEDEKDLIMYSTRENGSVGEELASDQDVDEAIRLKRIVESKFNNIVATVEVVDEWVHLNIRPLPKATYRYNFHKHSNISTSPLKSSGSKNSFDSVDELLKEVMNFSTGTEFTEEEIKHKLNSIENYPNNNFTGWYDSEPILISEPSNKGNNWGYFFSISKSENKNEYSKGGSTSYAEGGGVDKTKGNPHHRYKNLINRQVESFRNLDYSEKEIKEINDRQDRGSQYSNTPTYDAYRLNSYAKGGKTKTWKNKYNSKYDHPKDESHSLKDISKETGVSKKGLQKIYNKGIGAWKTNIGSVRLKKDFSKNKNTKKYPRKSRIGKEQWAMARVYSAVMGGKAAKVDAKELKMNQGGIPKHIDNQYGVMFNTDYERPRLEFFIFKNINGELEGEHIGHSDSKMYLDDLKVLNLYDFTIFPKYDNEEARKEIIYFIKDKMKNYTGKTKLMINDTIQ